MFSLFLCRIDNFPFAQKKSIPWEFQRILFLRSYSFTAPAEILLMMYFEKNANTRRIGMTEIATAR